MEQEEVERISMDEQQKPMVSPITLFYAYAHEDERLRRKLEKHLSLLRQRGLITEWHARQIIPGTDWAHAINTHLNSASVILLLISADFLASTYGSGIEMQRALERHQANEARVIPILLRPVDWKGAPFAHLQMLPTGARAVTAWSNQDEAFADVATGIRRAIEDLSGLTGLSDLASVSDKPEPVESSAPSTRPSTPVLLPPTHRNPLRQKRWLLVTVLTFVVLLGIVGIITSPLWHPNPTPSIACAAAPTLTAPADGLTLNSRIVILTWEAPQDCLPNGYTVRINADRDPEAKPWIVDTGWAPTDYTYTFSADGIYYWHIRACQPCTPFHPGHWAIRSFTIHTSLTP